MNRPVRLGLVGLGTVGGGVVQLLRKNRALIETKVGAPIELAVVCDKVVTPAQFKKLGTRAVFTRNADEVILNPDVDIFIELIGGYEPARTFVLKALQAGKHVVTANKALLAKYWGEVFRSARDHQRLVYFEASVGGGIPVIQALNEGLAGNRISKITGILNGTTNYVLTRMSQAGLDYPTAVKEAQKAGFAEADPTFDVEGIDAAHKIAILASIASGTWVRLADVVTEGITHIDSRDMAFVRREFGYVIKLLGITRLTEKTVEVRVHPALIPETHPFANVQNEYNAIAIEGDAVGDVILYGKGAGRMAAASAVVSDITYLARQVAARTAGKLPYISGDHLKHLTAVPKAEMKSRFYLRFTVADRPGVLAGVSGILSKVGVSIAGVYQPEHGFTDTKGVPIMILTHLTTEGAMEKALKEIGRQRYIRAKTILLRVEE
ncbi:MAG: homoserine dehydrogenase [Elusimicrobiota bacterium]|jgi:homoserine dehydrogenase